MVQLSQQSARRRPCARYARRGDLFGRQDGWRPPDRMVSGDRRRPQLVHRHGPYRGKLCRTFVPASFAGRDRVRGRPWLPHWQALASDTRILTIIVALIEVQANSRRAVISMSQTATPRILSPQRNDNSDSVFEL